MLLMIAFALFLLIIAAWVVAPTAATARRHEPVSAPAGVPAMGSRAA